MLGNQVLVDSADDLEIDFHGVEIQQRYAEFVRGSHGDGSRVGDFFTDQVRDEREALFSRGLDRFLELILGDDTVLYQPPRQARQIGL